MLEVRTNPLRLFLQGPQVSKQLALHGLRRANGFARIHSRFQIAVQVFIRVQFWRIAGQVKQLDLFGMLCQPCRNFLGMMNAQVVDDQKHFLARILVQALEKLDERVRVQRLPLEHEAQRALVGDSGNEIDPAALGLRED